MPATPSRPPHFVMRAAASWRTAPLSRMLFLNSPETAVPVRLTTEWLQLTLPAGASARLRSLPDAHAAMLEVQRGPRELTAANPTVPAAAACLPPTPSPPTLLCSAARGVEAGRWLGAVAVSVRRRGAADCRQAGLNRLAKVCVLLPPAARALRAPTPRSTPSSPPSHVPTVWSDWRQHQAVYGWSAGLDDAHGQRGSRGGGACCWRRQAPARRQPWRQRRP